MAHHFKLNSIHPKIFLKFLGKTFVENFADLKHFADNVSLHFKIHFFRLLNLLELWARKDSNDLPYAIIF